VHNDAFGDEALGDAGTTGIAGSSHAALVAESGCH
jgi:hypothetical protein